MTGALDTILQLARVLIPALHAAQADPTVDPADVAERVEQIMSDPAYEYGPSWWDRLVEWIEEQLAKLFQGQETQGPAPAAGAFGGGIGSLIAWLLIAAAVVALIAVVVYVLRNRVRRERGDDERATATEIEHRRTAAAWRSDAERLEAEGEWKLALRARYRELVRTLTDRQQLPDVAGRTTGELRGDLASTTPDAAAPFDTGSTLFELAWYADAPTGPDERDRFADAAQRVLAAPVVTGADDADDLDAGLLEVGR